MKPLPSFDIYVCLLVVAETSFDMSTGRDEKSGDWVSQVSRYIYFFIKKSLYRNRRIVLSWRDTNAVCVLCQDGVQFEVRMLSTTLFDYTPPHANRDHDKGGGGGHWPKPTSFTPKDSAGPQIP